MHGNYGTSPDPTQQKFLPLPSGPLECLSQTREWTLTSPLCNQSLVLGPRGCFLKSLKYLSHKQNKWGLGDHLAQPLLYTQKETEARRDQRACQGQ